jgi:glycine hydroxymethyltransferase
VNKNAVPNDPRSPFITSGIRVGTPAMTTRGFKEAEAIQLTHWICDIFAGLEKGNADAVIAEVKAKVAALCKKFPVYAE